MIGNKLRYGTRLAGGLLWLAAMVACSKGAEEEFTLSDEVIRLYTSARSGETAGDDRYAMLIFWNEDDYHNIINKDTWADPFFVMKPVEEINYYRLDNGIPFNTRHSYPQGNKWVHVSGYAPSTLTSTNQYKTLVIPEELRNGKMDFLSGDGDFYRKGSASRPFETVETEDMDPKPEIERLKRKQLEFCHLTSKIIFSARRDENMAMKVGVRNVKVVLRGQYVPTLLEWRTIDAETEWGGYFPSAPKMIEGIYMAVANTDPIVLGVVQKLDSCYVCSGNGEHFHTPSSPSEGVKGYIELKVDVTAELLPYDPQNQEWNYAQAEIKTWENISVIIDSNTGNELRMGYAYRILITFDTFGVCLQGVEMDWEDGGTHYVPITPVN